MQTGTQQQTHPQRERERDAARQQRPTVIVARRRWRARLDTLVDQEPLIDTRSSRRALRGIERGRPAPRTVLVGIGLCTRYEVSAALPLDVLGMLLPAERVRRALGAQRVIALVADEHALTNDLDARRVERRARETVALLQRIRQVLRLPRLQVVRAREFHDSPGFRSVLATVERRAAAADHPYLRRQIADLQFLDRAEPAGGVIKVGWVAGNVDDPRRRGLRDEWWFDRRFTALTRRALPFVYCKPGRALDEKRQLVSPYVARCHDRRICVRPGEDVRRKLTSARGHVSAECVNGVRNHLKRIARAVREVGFALSGPVEQRIDTLLHRLTDVDLGDLVAADRAARACGGEAAAAG